MVMHGAALVEVITAGIREHMDGIVVRTTGADVSLPLHEFVAKLAHVRPSNQMPTRLQSLANCRRKEADFIESRVWMRRHRCVRKLHFQRGTVAVRMEICQDESCCITATENALKDFRELTALGATESDAPEEECHAHRPTCRDSEHLCEGHLLGCGDE